MKVSFHYDIDKFRIRESRLIKKVLSRIVNDAGLKCGKVDVIMTSDRKLYEINREFLGHDYYTDIVTFNYNYGKTVSGELYISVERVKENAVLYSEPFYSEIRRVIFHGFLHLCGYDDRTEAQRRKMSDLEEMYLALSYAE